MYICVWKGCVYSAGSHGTICDQREKQTYTPSCGTVGNSWLVWYCKNERTYMWYGNKAVIELNFDFPKIGYAELKVTHQPGLC